MKSGNTINITYTDTTTSTQRTVTVMRVDDPSVLPLPQTATHRSERLRGRDRLLRRVRLDHRAAQRRAEQP